MSDKKENAQPNGKTTTTSKQEEVKRTWFTRSDDSYHKIEQIGRGTYGKVYKAIEKGNPNQEDFVALKMISMECEKEGFPITAMREIKILRRLEHLNIVRLLEIVTSHYSSEKDKKKSRATVCLVFEYVEHDLAWLLDHKPKINYSIPHLKCLFKQLLEGLHYLHSQGIIHRDIKGANLLINKKGILKIADFGLARIICKPNQLLTNRVITLWYRAPELLLGSQKYSSKIDLWSAGVFFVEMLTRTPLFPGKNEADQIELIYNQCGSPNEDDWPGVTSLPYFAQYGPKMRYHRRLAQTLRSKQINEAGIDLINKLLALNPEKRYSATEALKHPYFNMDPAVCTPDELPKVESEGHIYQLYLQREKERKERQLNLNHANNGAKQSNQASNSSSNQNQGAVSSNNNGNQGNMSTTGANSNQSGHFKHHKQGSYHGNYSHGGGARRNSRLDGDGRKRGGERILAGTKRKVPEKVSEVEEGEIVGGIQPELKHNKSEESNQM